MNTLEHHVITLKIFCFDLSQEYLIMTDLALVSTRLIRNKIFCTCNYSVNNGFDLDIHKNIKIRI